MKNKKCFGLHKVKSDMHKGKSLELHERKREHGIHSQGFGIKKTKLGIK